MTHQQLREYRAIAKQVFPRADAVQIHSDTVVVVLTESPVRLIVQVFPGMAGSGWGTYFHIDRTFYNCSVVGSTLEQALQIGKAKLREHYAALAPHVEDGPCP